MKPIKNASELDFSKVSVINWLESGRIWPTACCMAHTLVGVQNRPQIYLSSAQQPSYHYGLNKIQNDEVNKKDSCLDRCEIRKVQRDVFTFLEKPFSRILSGKVPSAQKIF